MQRLPLCKFPTTIFLVDDNPDFLASLNTWLELENCIPKAFSCPTAGLAALNTAARSQKSILLGSTKMTPVGIDNVNSEINISKLYEEAYSKERFNLISTVIVDFEMPGMNGLEFCKRIENPNIQKILLTGVIDESAAIEAFNNGIIDGFLKKQDPDLPEKLIRAVNNCNDAFFNKHSRSIDQSLRAVTRDYPAEDPAFVEFFVDLCRDQNIIEHYLCQSTGTFLLINQKQQLFSLFTKPSDLLDYEAGELSEYMQGTENLRLIQHKQKMMCFHSVDNLPFPDDLESERHLFETTKLDGLTEYYVSMMPNILPINESQIEHFQGGI